MKKEKVKFIITELLKVKIHESKGMKNYQIEKLEKRNCCLQVAKETVLAAVMLW